jgi:hypothetical protein
MSVHTEFAFAAAELVSEVGTSCTYKSVTEGVYDPATGVVTDTTTQYDVVAAIMDLTLQSNGLSLRYGTQVVSGDKEAYVIPPLGSIPITPGKDKLVVNGVEYTVATFKEVNLTGSDAIIYFLYLRR